MKRSSSLDCSSIGQSLKRVKISTSPGELRLDRDIESLVLGKQWTSTANNSGAGSNDGLFPNSNNGPSVPPWDRRGGRIHGELHCPNARLVRDPVDPLRLRLTCLHQPMPPNNNGHSSSSSPIPPERWTFLIQMPRMYPHVPPAITRVTRDFVPNNENVAHLGNMNVDHGGSAYAAIVASSAMQGRAEPPVPEQVLIRPLPPTPHSSGTHAGGNGGHDDKLPDIDSATAVFDAWSPVSSLQDLIDFLRGIPSRRREWWSAEGNKGRHQERQHLLGYRHGAAAAPVGHPTIAPASSGSFFHQQQQQRHFQPVLRPKEQHQFSMSHCDRMEDDGDMNIVESMMMEDGRHEFAGAIPTERRANPFTANRFDVGYERGALIRQHQRWGVR